MNLEHHEEGGRTVISKRKTSSEEQQARIEQLEAEKAALQQRLAQLNGDFTAFQDFYFVQNPTQA